MTTNEIETCNRCGSDDVRQEISFMINPNTYNGSILDVNHGVWEDYYFCEVCQDECHVETKKDQHLEVCPTCQEPFDIEVEDGESCLVCQAGE